jgi:hypothetical protein
MANGSAGGLIGDETDPRHLSAIVAAAPILPSPAFGNVQRVGITAAFTTGTTPSIVG